MAMAFFNPEAYELLLQRVRATQMKDDLEIVRDTSNDCVRAGLNGPIRAGLKGPFTAELKGPISAGLKGPALNRRGK